jgi:alpha-beta hydrolase superfamily lysophospholipase
MALVLVASCAPLIVPPGPAVTEPRLATDAIVAVDGALLPLKSWLPAGQPKAVIVGLHGFNDYSNAFARPSRYLTEHGIAVYAFDQRGFGAAPNTGRWAGDAAMVDDADAALRLVAARNPDVPLYLLGESMGGATAILAMTRRDAPPVAGLILAAPAVWGRRDMNFVERAVLWVSAHSLPWMTVSGRGLNILPSDNIEMLRELGRDRLVIKDSRIDTLKDLVDLMDDAYDAAPSIKGPALLLYGELDQVVPPEPSYAVMAALDGRKGVVRAVYPHGYHMLLRDLQADVVLADIVAWIEHPDAALPSGADRRASAVLAGRSEGTPKADAKNPG